MKRLVLGAVSVFLIAPSMAQAQVGTAFTYQGRLTEAGSPPSGAYDFEFQLFTLATGGTGSTIRTLDDVPVTDGLFTVVLDFGAAFTGSPRWLEVRVRPGASAGAYTALTPRQALTPSPNAVFSSTAGSVDWANVANKPAGVGLNPLKVALLQWGESIQGGDFTVGTLPWGVAFDGANIWVASASGNNVTKLLGSTGALVGTFPVGSSPTGVAFDGANVWVANQNTNNVTKLLASTGALVGTFAVGVSPYGVAFDGTNIWVANLNSNDVTKLLASTGALLGTFPVGFGPIGVAFDGANIWVPSYGGNTVSKR